MNPDEPKNLGEPSLFDLKFDPSKKNSSYLQHAKCNQGQPCVTLCISQHCQAEAALCIDEQCKCKQNHDQENICSRGPLSKIVSKTEKKRQTFPQLLKWVNKKYNDLVDWISIESEKFQQQMNSLGLNQDQNLFLNTVYEGKCNKLTGKQMCKVVNGIKLESKTLKQMTDQIQDKLSKLWERCVENIQMEVVSINSQITKMCLQGVEVKKEEIVGLNLSKVLVTEAERATVTEMLKGGNRKVEKIELLYRASENNFSTEKFWEKCDHKTDTVTVARTEFDKVIGGYTPLSWKWEKHLSWEQDSSLRSFVFSVTEKTKFTLKQSEKHHAIYHRRKYGPRFGNGTDFILYNYANSNSSGASIGLSYENSDVFYNTKESWQFFQGSIDSNLFTTKEWEVWQVTFK